MRRLTDKETNILKRIKEIKNLPYLRACVYARKSSEDEFQTALDSQINQCKQLVKLNSEYLVLNENHIFSEENRSGMFMDNRTELHKAIELIETNQADVIVVHTIERFSRNVKDLKTLQEVLQKHNAILICTDMPTEDTAVGEFLQNMFVLMGQMYSRQTAEKCYRSLENKARDCRITGGIPNYGYQYLADRYAINPEESVAIELMFKGVIDGKTYEDISMELDALGFRTRKNKPFSNSTINDILRNVKYCGTFLYNRKDGKRKKHRVLLGSYDEIRIENGITDAIIDRETFDRVQEILNQRTLCHSSTRQPQHLLTGLIRCKQCGELYVGNTRQSRDKKIWYSYICKNRLGKHRTCKSSEIKAEYLENYVKDVVLQVINNQIINKRFSSNIFTEYLQKNKFKTSNLTRELTDLEAKIDKIIELMIISNSQSVQDSLELKLVQLKECKQRKEYLHNQLKCENTKLIDMINRIQQGTPITSQQLYINNHKTKELINLVVQSIEIDDRNDSIEIELR